MDFDADVVAPPDPGLGLLQRLAAAGHQVQAAALGRERLGNGQADALGRAGHQRGLARELKIHGRWSLTASANEWKLSVCYQTGH
jgi:hypothetical protein